jgi:hypothetical protein
MKGKLFYLARKEMNSKVRKIISLIKMKDLRLLKNKESLELK